jgi:hypothetical protein
MAMPFFYDLSRSVTTNASAGTASTHLWGKTIANQETLGIYGIYATGRSATAGGGQVRALTNTGTVASGGTAMTPQARNLRGSVAAQSTWFNDATAITAGVTLTQRLSVGFAQTGGMGGWVPLVPSDAFQMMPNSLNPVDVEFVSAASAASVPFDITLELGEGI